jgi:hypothetical protein
LKIQNAVSKKCKEIIAQVLIWKALSEDEIVPHPEKELEALYE